MYISIPIFRGALVTLVINKGQEKKHGAFLECNKTFGGNIYHFKI